MQTKLHYVSNGSGWKIALKQTYDQECHDPELKPLAIIPGYGMNAYIFGYHPNGLSMEEHLARHGFEVWSLNLRNQGPSVCTGGGKEYYIQDIVCGDISAAVDYILENTLSNCSKVDLIGASLGGTYAYLYAALVNQEKAGSLVGIGSPLKMENVHPAFAMVTFSPRLLGLIKFSHTRLMAKFALPFITRWPRLIYIYLHPEIVDMSRPDLLLPAIENPNRNLNTQLAHWVKEKDLIIDGKNMTEIMKKVKNPVLCIIANADGIVSEEVALSVHDAVSGDVKDYFVAGNDTVKMAHADLFVSNYAGAMVFEPLAKWLAKQNE